MCDDLGPSLSYAWNTTAFRYVNPVQRTFQYDSTGRAILKSFNLARTTMKYLTKDDCNEKNVTKNEFHIGLFYTICPTL